MSYLSNEMVMGLAVLLGMSLWIVSAYITYNEVKKSLLFGHSMKIRVFCAVFAPILLPLGGFLTLFGEGNEAVGLSIIFISISYAMFVLPINGAQPLVSQPICACEKK